MSFLHPEFFYLMLAPLVILFALFLTQKEASTHFFSDEVLAKLRVHSGAMSLKMRNVLFFLIGFLLIVALAEPVIEEGEIEIRAKSSDVMLALDISDSMLAQDLYPNRLRVAKEKALSFLEKSKNERLGVIAFAKDSFLVSPLSFDNGAVRFLLERLETNSITQKGTDFLSLLEVLQRSHAQKKGQKYLFILTDGGDTDRFDTEIAYAKKHDIVVFVLAVATQKGSPIKLEDGSFIKHKGEIIISKRNEAIAELATATGGVYIQSTRTDEDIQTMLREIQKIADKKELKSQTIKKYIQLFYFPLGLAVFLLLLATSSMSKREAVQLPSAFLLLALFMDPMSSEAGVLDFKKLHDAKEAYENGAYERASRLYGDYAKEHANAQSYFNAGNAYYKQKKYQEAIEYYEKADFSNKQMQSQRYANMGNAYAKQATLESLNKAAELYEKSLKLFEDKETKENLKRVKELLKHNEQQEQEKKNGEDKEKNQEENQEKNKQEGKDQESFENQKQEAKDQKTQDQQNSENQKQESKDQKTQDQQSSENQKQEGQDSEPQESQEEHKESQSSDATPLEMSDAEEKKWLEALNKESRTFMYRLSPQQKQEHNSDEKPW